MTRVFYIECAGPVWQAVAANCQALASWEPALWTAPATNEDAIRRAYPKAVFIAGPDATLGLESPGCTWPLATLEPALLTALAPIESIALHMMDRMDLASGGAFTHDQRRRHYHQLLRYWLGALDALNPEVLVFSISPHVVFDYVLFAVARHRGLTTVMFERLGLPGWVFPIGDFEQGSDTLRHQLEQMPVAKADDLTPIFQKWFVDSTRGSASVPANFQKKLERYSLEGRAAVPSLTRAVAYELKRAINLWRKYGFAPMRNSYLRSAHYPHGRAAWGETLRARIRGLLLKRRLTRVHDHRCSQPIAGQDYVFFALHYQPERATVPLGGVFGDQLLIVDFLASALPQGWKLYVKEHPWQLQPFGWGEMQRTEAFYDDVLRHPNVILLPRDIDTSDMVKGARTAATVTGSVGWEALCSGIPVLLFGAAWYRDCPGVFAMRSIADAQTAFQKIADGYKVDLAGVAAFVHALSQVCVPGVLEPELESTGSLSVDSAIPAMAVALVQFVASQQYLNGDTGGVTVQATT